MASKLNSSDKLASVVIALLSFGVFVTVSTVCNE